MEQRGPRRGHCVDSRCAQNRDTISRARCEEDYLAASLGKSVRRVASHVAEKLEMKGEFFFQFKRASPFSGPDEARGSQFAGVVAAA